MTHNACFFVKHLSSSSHIFMKILTYVHSFYFTFTLFASAWMNDPYLLFSHNTLWVSPHVFISTFTHVCLRSKKWQAVLMWSAGLPACSPPAPHTQPAQTSSLCKGSGTCARILHVQEAFTVWAFLECHHNWHKHCQSTDNSWQLIFKLFSIHTSARSFPYDLSVYCGNYGIV